MMTTRGDNPSPTADFVFRKLFGSEENKDLLISLINSVVEPSLHLTDVVIKNPFNLAAYKEAKESVVDIKAMDQDGTWYTIEMQVLGQDFYGKRAIYYAAKGYVDQLEAGQHYSALNTTIGIHFLAFDLFADSRVARQFVFKDRETNEHPDDLQFLQLHFIEIGKFHKDWSEISTACDRWVAFMTKDEELHHDSLPSALGADPAIVKAVAVLERIGADPEQRAIYEAEENAKLAELGQLMYAEKKGIKQGIEQGIEQGIRHMQHMLLRQMTRQIGEVPLSIETRLNRLTMDQLDNLDEALFDLNSYAEVEAWLGRQ